MRKKCVILNFTKNFNDKWSFFDSLRFCVFDLCLFCNGMLIIYNITYTAISIKVVTETIVKCAIWADWALKRRMMEIIGLSYQ